MSHPMSEAPRKIDMHMHMVGNGSSGSGSWLRLRGWHRWLAGFMVRQLGLSADILEGDLDRLYAERVRELIATSSFDAAVLLAHSGGEHTIPVVNAKLADPRRLRFPLECGVTVIAAHCGTSSGAFDHDYFADWAGMLREFPNLYGDNSALVSLNRCAHLREC